MYSVEELPFSSNLSASEESHLLGPVCQVSANLKDIFQKTIYKWGGEGGHINIFVFTHRKNNRFQKKLIVQNMNL